MDKGKNFSEIKKQQTYFEKNQFPLLQVLLKVPELEDFLFCKFGHLKYNY